MNKLTSIKNVKNLKGKKVLVRVDFNVPIVNNRVEEAFRIERTMPTIKFLKKAGAKIILISHITDGRTKSLKPMAKYLDVKFIANKNLDQIKKETDKLKNSEIVLLENIRNFKGEEKNDSVFAKKLASLGDFYVNEAFSVSHRAHASIVGLPKYLPHCVGFLFEEEYKNLSALFKPQHPFFLILGGIKFETKLGVLNKFLNIADKIFIGGALANNFLKAQGKDIGASLFDKSVNISKYLNNKKIILPIDVKTKNGKILDAGPKTVKLISELIKKNKIILWNGPLGDFEQGFAAATLNIARVIALSKAKTVIGGGDTVNAVKKVGLKRFSFVSTAGGAMLDFLAKGTLPGIEAIK
jgi:3-phosphoglycerate kinase